MQRPFPGKARGSMPWVIGLAAVGLLGVGAVVLVATRQSSPSAEQLNALTVPVETSSVALRIRASGTVQPFRTVNISPATSDILDELYVEQGDRVTRGQVIALMKNDTAAANVAQAEAQVAQAQSRLQELETGNRPEDIAQAQARVEQAQALVVEAESQVVLATERVERQQFLYAEGAIAQDGLDEATNTVNAARATLERQQASLREAQENLRQQQSGSRVESIDAARAQVAEAEASLQAASVRYEDTFIRAPFNGIITQRYASEGAFVAPTTSASTASSATSSAIVAIAEGLEILAEVPEVDIAQIQLGQRVEVMADAYPEEVFEGRVRLVAPEAVIEQNVTSFQVRIELLEGQDRLRSQMNVDVEFIGETVDQALVVPTVAIVTQQGDTGVLVPDDQNRIRFRRVTLGPAVGNQTQILSGLESGDRVFVDLPPGQRLENLNFGDVSEEE
ncbi:MAG: efflux RND transporter periplasmic adaptor subunit [Synechococcales cyanobacterium K44_A2020_017]|nr:efflux RND transporter periplasmic adaptor subunit [Synechococcales cyanobacterium K32_A2020_035]MBF2094007.1 efflux RND transporter periplasmic adaptor subunit [Synechococcales cyanobacterium K44_A2020_017]